MHNKKQFIFCLLAGIALLFDILYGGPKLSAYAFNEEKKTIDKNGLELRAIVSEKRQAKGHLIYFKYNSKDRIYSTREQDGDNYEVVHVGDSIDIKMDTTNPTDAYILHK